MTAQPPPIKNWPIGTSASWPDNSAAPRAQKQTAALCIDPFGNGCKNDREVGGAEPEAQHKSGGQVHVDRICTSDIRMRPAAYTRRPGRSSGRCRNAHERGGDRGRQSPDDGPQSDGKEKLPIALSTPSSGPDRKCCDAETYEQMMVPQVRTTIGERQELCIAGLFLRRQRHTISKPRAHQARHYAEMINAFANNGDVRLNDEVVGNGPHTA